MKQLLLRRDTGCATAILLVALLVALSAFRNKTTQQQPPIVDISLEDLEFHTVATVDERYASFTLDWWPKDQGSPFPPPSGWGPHANVLDVNLQDPKLRALVKALGPSILRIGGTMDKIVEYDFPEYGSECNHTASTDHRPPPCLNASRWDELHEFARATNSKIVFGLSFPDGKNGTWDPSKAAALMRHSVHQHYTRQTTLFGFELGEELTKFEPGTRQFDNYVTAYHKCAYLLRTIFDDEDTKATTNKRPLLMGPCPGMAWPTLATWFPAFLEATKDILDVAVYHSYNQIEYPDKFYLNKTVPSGNVSTQQGTGSGDTGWQAIAMKRFVNEINRNIVNRPPIALWLGEMGPHNGGGGRGNISSAFASSFGYIDTLGTLARLNHQVLARQTLVGGKYELLRSSTGIDEVCDFEPHPDYYVALLWSRLMGTIVLNAPNDDNGMGKKGHDWGRDLHFHIHCSQGIPEREGSITVAFSNKSPVKSYVVSTATLGSLRVEYVLTAHLNNESENRESGSDHDVRFDTRQVSLNGKLLHMGNTSRLPDLRGKHVPNVSKNPWMIAPASLGFVVLPEADVSACKMSTAEA